MRRIRIVLVLAGAAALVVLALVLTGRHANQEDADVKNLAERISKARGDDKTVIVELALDPDLSADTLIRALKSPDDSMRTEAARILGLRAERRAVAALVEGMNRPQAGSARWCALALGRIGDPQAVEPLIQKLELSTKQIMTVGPSLKSAGPATSMSFADSLMSAQGVPLDYSEVAVIEALGGLRDPKAAGPLVERLKACRYDAYGNPGIACEAAIAQIGPPAVPVLVAAVYVSDWSTQQRILRVLGEIGDGAAVKPILECFGRPEKPVPQDKLERHFTDTVHLALAKIGTPEALAYLSHCSIHYDGQDELSRDYVNALLRRSPDSLDAIINLITCHRCVPNEAVSKELVRLKDPKSFPSLISVLGTGNGAEAAVQAFGSQAVAPLIEAIKTRPDYALFPIAFLGQTGDPQAIPPLWEYIRANPQRLEQGYALLALAKLGDRTVIPMARQWIARWPDDAYTAPYAINALAALGDTDSIPRIAQIARTAPSAVLSVHGAGHINSARATAVRALAALKAPDAAGIAVQIAAEPIKGQDEVARAAIAALVTLKSRDSVPVLLKIIEGPVPMDFPAIGTWQAAIEAIGQLGDASCAPALLAVVDKTIEAGDGWGTRQAGIIALDALAKVGAKDAFDHLSRALTRWDQAASKDERILASAPDGGTRRIGTLGDALCRAIACSGDPRAFDRLIQALQGKSYSCRCGAVRSLEQLGDARAFGHLASMLDYSDNQNPRLIAEALLKMDADGAIEPLLRWLAPPKMPSGEAQVVRMIGRRGTPHAAEALKSKLEQTMLCPSYVTFPSSPHDIDWAYAEMRDESFLSMPYELPLAYARCAGKGALPLCILALRVPSNWYLQTGAAEALGELHDPQGLKPLIAALGDKAWPVQEAAARSLGQIGDPAALKPLEAATRYGDIRVRKAAIKAIEAIKQATATTSSNAASRPSLRGY